MAVEWSRWGPDLLVRLDRAGADPVGAQLQSELREAIRTGRLAPGERLPSSRAMAADLGVSRGLVQASFEQLVAEGYLETHERSATRVAATAAVVATPSSRPRAAAGIEVDFRPGVPDLRSFPTRDWLWALGEAARTAPTATAGYGDPQGDATLRGVVAAYLRRVRSAAVELDDVIICNGFTQGVRLVLEVLARRGIREVGFEDPGHPDVITLADRAGLEAVPIPVDDHGIEVGALAATSVSAVVVTPAHQTPTGVVLAPERRQALVAWARERDAVIIEDDYDAEFRYDRQPVGSLQGLAPDRVASIGSVSKSMAPMLRLGWIAAPSWMTGELAEAKHAADRGAPGLDQLALARLIESGRYDRHLRRMRSVYATRRTALLETLARRTPHVQLTGLAAGFHAVASLHESADEAAVVAAALERSVGLYALNHYRRRNDHHPPRLVLGFGNLTVDAIDRGIARVHDLLEEGW
jgi:GntR family transcriptional regulator/MocR family aminotransferase